MATTPDFVGRELGYCRSAVHADRALQSIAMNA
jgi:hypothetical protein